MDAIRLWLDPWRVERIKTHLRLAAMLLLPWVVIFILCAWLVGSR